MVKLHCFKARYFRYLSGRGHVFTDNLAKTHKIERRTPNARLCDARSFVKQKFTTFYIAVFYALNFAEEKSREEKRNILQGLIDASSYPF